MGSMNTSLDSLINYLSGKIYNSKCKHCSKRKRKSHNKCLEPIVDAVG